MTKRVEVPHKDAILAQAFTLEALINVLEKKNIVTRKELLEEIKILQAETSSPKN